MKVVVAAIGDWNKDLYDKRHYIDGEWFYVSDPDELKKKLTDINPDYIFFIHWRWIVPQEIVKSYDCICFHMTDVPYGRGGSPLQNLIVRGHKETVLTALKMEEGLDTGPVYLKYPLSLEGTAEQIYKRASALSWIMIEEIITNQPKPVPQQGKVTLFKRRTPEQSELPTGLSAEQIYDYIRMLDAPGYPHAFLNKEGYRIEFTNAVIEDGCVKATAKICMKD